MKPKGISPTPHGVGGLKYLLVVDCVCYECPTPHGVGGLKCCLRSVSDYVYTSHPSRGGWIEMEMFHRYVVFFPVPPLTGWVD